MLPARDRHHSPVAADPGTKVAPEQMTPELDRCVKRMSSALLALSSKSIGRTQLNQPMHQSSAYRTASPTAARFQTCRECAPQPRPPIKNVLLNQTNCLKRLLGQCEAHPSKLH